MKAESWELQNQVSIPAWVRGPENGGRRAGSDKGQPGGGGLSCLVPPQGPRTGRGHLPWEALRVLRPPSGPNAVLTQNRVRADTPPPGGQVHVIFATTETPLDEKTSEVREGEGPSIHPVTGKTQVTTLPPGSLHSPLGGRGSGRGLRPCRAICKPGPLVAPPQPAWDPGTESQVQRVRPMEELGLSPACDAVVQARSVHVRQPGLPGIQCLASK